MIVYAATKQQFLKDNDNDDIEEVILRHYKEATGKNVGTSEIRGVLPHRHGQFEKG